MTLGKLKVLTTTRIQKFKYLIRGTASVAQQRTEPEGPKVITEVPGPKTLEISGKLNGNFQSTSNLQLAINYQKSFGNYVVDADDNLFLDFHQQIASLPLGYNHPRIIEALKSDEFLTVSASRSAIGMYPDLNWPNMVNEVLLRCAPKGLKTVQTQMCGGCAVENAMKSIFLAHMEKERNGKAPTKEELDSALYNERPGAVNYSFLSFMGSFHGRTLACLSLTRSKARHKLDFPAFAWPAAPFPRYRYPLAEFEDENLAEDDRCLARVEELMEEEERNGGKVIGAIIEPIQAEGGDAHASDEFFRRLRSICSQRDCHFVVDEVQTGVGVTGKFWAHEHWDLDEPPDIVTFSKKMLASGYFMRTGAYIPTEAYLIMNTWLGEHGKVLLLRAVLDAIEEENLMQAVRETGDEILTGLEELEREYPDKLSRVRGRGTFIGFDCPSPAARQRLLVDMRQRGVLIAACGDRSVRLRPALIVTSKHVNIFLETMSHALREF